MHIVQRAWTQKGEVYHGFGSGATTQASDLSGIHAIYSWLVVFRPTPLKNDGLR